jgi:hypothetical protein
VSLFKTRVILRLIARIGRGNKIVGVAVAALDFIVYSIIFGIGLLLLMSIEFTLTSGRFQNALEYFNIDFIDFIMAVIVGFLAFAFLCSYLLALCYYVLGRLRSLALAVALPCRFVRNAHSPPKRANCKLASMVS